MTSEDSQKTLQASSAIIDVEDYRKAMLNILEDFAAEKNRLEGAYRAAINILEDFAGEKAQFEESQRAMLNLLDDFSMERTKTEAVNSELREAEDQITRSLREKETLLKEIHHRVKNNLQIIYSMLNLQMPYIKDEQAIEMFKESKDRVYSMALIHEKLYRSESLAKIDLFEYIRSLIENLFLSYGVSERVVKTQIQVENIALEIDTLIPCALIINELVSNSLKHAFPNVRQADETGEIQIDLRRAAGSRLVLTISDNGVGLPEGLDIQNCESLGMQLVNVLVKQLNGIMHLDSKGKTEFVITFAESKRGRK